MKKLKSILNSLFYLVLWVSALSTVAQDKANTVVYLKNKAVIVGVSLDTGGRVVFLGRSENNNVLLSDLDSLSNKIPVPLANAPIFKEYNGHITWLAPKSNWWSQQNINSEYKNKGKTWPPDPFVIYGRYKIITQSNSSLTILGPPSPVSGIQMKKIIRIRPDGKVIFTVIVKNISNSKRKWGIWSNTRLSGSAVCFASIDNSKTLKSGYVYPATGKDRNLTFFIKKNYFSFINKINWIHPQTRAYSKAGFTSLNGAIFAFYKNNMFVKRFPMIDLAKVSPGHYPVEIFLKIHNFSQVVDILELENHGEYTSLAPGKEISLTETWEVLPFTHKAGKALYFDAIEKYWKNQKTQL